MVAEGDAVTEAPDVAESPVAGDHEYVLAPEAVRETFPPGAMVADAGETDTVGAGLTATVITLENAVLVPSLTFLL